MKNFDKLILNNSELKLQNWDDTSKHTLFGYLANKSLKWFPSDTEDLFKKNIKTNFEDLGNYLNNPIEYKLNNNGFRTYDNLTLNDYGNVFLGCSHTFGVGHHLKNTWAYKLNNFIEGKFYNLSQPGCGVETDYRMLYSFKNTIKIKNVFHFLGFYPRYEVFENEFFNNVHFTDDDDIIKYKSIFHSHTSNEKLLINQLAHTQAIKLLCSELGVNYYLICDFEFFNDELFNLNKYSKNKARDLIHFSVEIHDELFKKFKKMYLSN